MNHEIGTIVRKVTLTVIIKCILRPSAGAISGNKTQSTSKFFHFYLWILFPANTFLSKVSFQVKIIPIWTEIVNFWIKNNHFRLLWRFWNKWTNFWLCKVVLYLASNYSLKDEICIDPIELLHQLWSGISKIFRQKARRAEILNEIIFNVTDIFALQKIKTEILKVQSKNWQNFWLIKKFQVQNFDFIHDLNLGHCIEHFHAHAKLIEEQNQILELIRYDTIESLRNWLGEDSIKDCFQLL